MTLVELFGNNMPEIEKLTGPAYRAKQIEYIITENRGPRIKTRITTRVDK